MTPTHPFAVLVMLTLLAQAAVAQEYAGFRTGNYTGVNGVFFNPANIADSRYRWDLNLVAVGIGLGNNQVSFNTDEVTDGLFIEQRLASSLFNLDVHGPSLMFNAGKKTSVALTTRVRAMANVVDADGGLVNAFLNDVGNDVGYPYLIAGGSNMRMAVNGWSEWGFSFARIVKEVGAHFIKAGITAKYLGGMANGYIALDQLSGTIEEDADGEYLRNTRGRVAIGFGGIDIGDVQAADLTSFVGTGFGGDIGLVYEYRPDHATHRHEDQSWKRYQNKYKCRVGVSLLDVGAIRYDRDVTRSGDYTINIGGDQKFYTDEVGDAGAENIKYVLDDNPQFFSPESNNDATTYRVQLPTTLQIDADYRLHRGFYANLGTQLSLARPASKLFNTQYYSAITVTPRFEGAVFGLYLPFNYNALTDFNAGVSMRFGPLFFGTNSGLTALLGNSKQADVFFGLHVGGLQNNRKLKRQARKAPKVKA